VAAVPGATATGLLDVSGAQGGRLVAQAAGFGAAALSRAADLAATGLTEMRGATAPRLLLELICARVLLLGADDGTDGLMARIDRLEKRAAITGGAPSQTTAPSPRPPVEHPVQPVPEASAPPVPQPAAPPVEAPAPREPERAAPATQAPPAAETTTASAAPEGGLTLVDVRRLWPDIVEATKLRRRVAWMHLTQNSQVIGVEDNTLVLGFNNAGARDSFVNGGCDEILRQSAIDVVGVDWKIDAIVDPGARPDSGPPRTAGSSQGTQPPAETPGATTLPGSADSSRAEPTTSPSARLTDPGSVAAARGAITPTRSGEPAEDPRASADADAHPDDPDADAGGLDTTELLQRELGAQVIEETPNK